MTVSDDMHGKLTNVTAQLGRERSKNDWLDSEYKTLKEDCTALQSEYRSLQNDYRIAMQRIRDLQNIIARMDEDRAIY